MKKEELNNDWKTNVKSFVEQDVNSNKILTEILKKYLPSWFIEEEDITYSADFLASGLKILKNKISGKLYKKIMEALKLLSENSRMYGNAFIKSTELSGKEQELFKKRSLKSHEIAEELKISF